MKNLILLSINLIAPNKLYEQYLQLYSSKLITNPMIFTDRCGVVVDKSIPVFNLSYLKNIHKLSYNPNIVCTDADYETLENLCKFGHYFIIDTMNKPHKNYYTISLQDLSNAYSRK